MRVESPRVAIDKNTKLATHLSILQRYRLTKGLEAYILYIELRTKINQTLSTRKQLSIDGVQHHS
jgi:hypothetical protein